MSMLDSVKKEGTGLPPRIVLHAGPKWGKTSFAAHAKDAIFALVNRETGLETLLDAGLVPPVAYYPQAFAEWEAFVDFVRTLLSEKHSYKWLVVDTGNGLERLCFEFINRTVFNGDWGAFGNYSKGYDRSMVPWQMMLDMLDELRSRKHMGVILLHHSKAKDFNDPAGKSWNMWVPEGHEKLSGLTMKWADAVLFGGSEVALDKEFTSGDMKPTGTVRRYLQCGANPAMTAGTRYGLPDRISSTGGPKGLWEAFGKAVNEARRRSKPGDDPKPADGKPAEPAKDDKKPEEKKPDATPAENKPADEKPPTGEPAAEPTKAKKTKRATKFDLTKDWYAQDFLAKYDVSAVKEFAEAIERLQASHYDFFTAPDEHPDVREYVREVIVMSDLAENFMALTNEQVQPAAKAVVAWLELGKPEPTPPELRPRS